MQNMKTYVLWGIRPNDFLEDFITETNDLKTLEKAKQEALKNGITKLRVLIVEGYEKPDFIGTINK